MHSKTFSSRLDHSHQTDPYSVWKFSPSYSDKGLPLPQSILESYVNCVKSGLLDDGGADTTAPPQSDNLAQAGAELTGQLEGHAHSHLAITVRLMLAQHCLNSTATTADIKADIELDMLLPKIVSQRKPDFELALAYLASAGKQGLKVLAETNAELGLDYSKIISLACLGIKFCMVTGFLKPVESFKTLLVKATWGKKIEGLGISFKNAFMGKN